jgi:hypothetical protein
MNNEPVAWARQDGVIAFFEKPEIDKQGFKWFALYTHLAKTLTDEEITDIAKEHIHQRLEGERFGYVDFARAILRKAQEK